MTLYQYECNFCAASEDYNTYRGSKVCPWCGEGVLQFIDELEVEDDDETTVQGFWMCLR